VRVVCVFVSLGRGKRNSKKRKEKEKKEKKERARALSRSSNGRRAALCERVGEYTRALAFFVCVEVFKKK
jgi:hypothetical protein